MLPRLATVHAKVQTDLTSQLSVARETSAEKLQELEEGRRQAIANHADWEANTYRPATSAASDRLRNLQRSMGHTIQDAFNPHGEVVRKFLDQYDGKTAQELIDGYSDIQAKLFEHCGGAATTFLGRFIKDAMSIIEETEATIGFANDRSRELSNHVESSIATPRTNDRLRVNETSLLETAQNTMFGASTGFAVGSLATFALSVVFPPAAGLSLVAVAAAMYGAGEKNRMAGVRRNEEAFQRLKQAIAEQMGAISRGVVRQFEQKSDEAIRDLNGLYESATKQMKTDLDRQLAEVKAAGGRTREEAKTQVAALSQKLQGVQAIGKQLQSAATALKG